jgi:hypothetical protein
MARMAIIPSSARMITITSSKFPAESGPITSTFGGSAWVEVDRHHLVPDRVHDVVVADAVFAGRSMDLHQRSS